MNFTIGDTPEQLNTKLAHIDSALPVDGLVYTQETVRQLKAERDALAAQNEKIIAEFKDAMETLQTIAGCTWDSGAEEIADVALDEAKRWVSRWDDSVLKKAPAQHLAEIRAEAVSDD